MEKNFRHEYKYLISRASAELLKQRLKGFMEYDPHAGKRGYTIRSLYFDDLSADAFYDKVSGVDNRTKYRIRCYNYSNAVFKLEKKEKKGHLTRKTAQTISLSQVQAIQQNPRVIPSVAEGSTDLPGGEAGKIPPLPTVGRNDSLLEELRLYCCTSTQISKINLSLWGCLTRRRRAEFRPPNLGLKIRLTIARTKQPHNLPFMGLSNHQQPT